MIPEMSKPGWKTKEGKLIPISRLEDSHLLNIYRMLDRQTCSIRAVTRAYLHPVLGPRGDMAQLAAGTEMEKMWEDEFRKERWLVVLKIEIVRRGLELPARIRLEPLLMFELVETADKGQVYHIIEEKR